MITQALITELPVLFAFGTVSARIESMFQFVVSLHKTPWTGIAVVKNGQDACTWSEEGMWRFFSRKNTIFRSTLQLL